MEEKKNTLLIVDDENANLKVLTHILGSEYTIFTASNGASAIEKAKEFIPDLILLDIMMPDMDGYATLTEIKNCEVIQKIPVIFITGLDSDEDEEKGLSLEAADYITKPFSATIVKLRVRSQIQIVNQMRTIERLSMIDQLTNIPNRRSFDERLPLEWGRAIRTQTPISILILDLDHFKNYNDTYGHLQGDKALQVVAKVFIQELKRSGDIVARWGGEEFAILLSDTDINGAMDIAERIRLKIENLPIPLADDSVSKITASIGVYSLVPTKNDVHEDFIRNADMALYTAKREGRNRVCQYSGRSI